MSEPDASAANDVLNIGFLLLPGFPLMSYAAAVEPLRAANQLAGRPLYRWWHASPDDRPVCASNGVAILPDLATGDASPATARVFVCAGGNPSAFDDTRVFGWLRRLARTGVAIGGISGGPYVLARAGLLEGHRCTVHWEHGPAFAESFPATQVTRSLYEIDRGRITCSGGIAALDLMLHFVAQDHGAELAAAVSDWFLHNGVRDGPSPQQAVPLRFATRDPRLHRVLTAMDAHVETPLARDALAAIACVSVRQLERLFRETLGRGLHAHYLDLRLRQARRLERETAMPVTAIARATGFSSAAELRRVQRRGASFAGARHGMHTSPTDRSARTSGPLPSSSTAPRP